MKTIKKTIRTRLLSTAWLNSLDSETLDKQATKLLLNIMLDLWNRNYLTLADFNYYEDIAKNSNADIKEAFYSKQYKITLPNADNTKKLVIDFVEYTNDLIIASKLEA
jgi:hypothetical protein